ncbi:MBL fold metallo-hydrolase [Alteribacillus bidgolensis]|uniref:Competence protein ComEA helix-hairpin-helix repeat region n=1 Tax=Alteribacillus bidgolensis TaxID=930129 RepID=A0A1G8CIL3_9BACI|nr:MBL fold metallo-hydrolase [Alteribacillus bidgolensis]SDH45275.1 competence protein ComEA helix-hairpin-helix repeat region [Alteribacillus bidgolensis]
MKILRYMLTLTILFSFLLTETTLTFSEDSQVFASKNKTVRFDDDDDLALFTESHTTLDFHFLDVGQGDSTLIVSDTGAAMLIDGGKPECGKEIVRYLNEAGIDKLEWVVATHPDIDHIGGLVEVLEEMDVEKVLDSGREHDTKTYQKYRKIIKDKKIDFFLAEEGERVKTKLADQVNVLNSYSDSDVRNDSSIVLQIEYGDTNVLLAGDATVVNEKDMMKKYDLESDIIKVAHHGSLTSTGSEFIEKVDPEIAIIPFDKKNTFGHPNASVVNRLRNTGADIYTTEHSGHILVSLYKENMYISKKPWTGKGRKFPTPVPRIHMANEKTYKIDKPVNINTASKKEIAKLPHISPVAAELVVEYKDANGPFRTKEELIKVSGVGKYTYKKINKYITT